MKKMLILLALALMVFTLSACNDDDSKSNTISEIDLTEREDAILSTTSDQSFLFDFTIDSEYQDASVWIEKYESGELVDEQVSYLKSGIKDKGTVIFAISRPKLDQDEHTFNIGVNSNGSTGSLVNNHSLVDYENMASVWGSIQNEMDPTKGELVLGSINYSSSEGGMSSLTPDFYENVEDHITELEKYDVTFLLKAEFTK